MSAADSDAGGATSTAASDEVVRAMVREHAAAVYRLALSIVRDPALAEDVAQETFIKAWRAHGTYLGAAPLRNWILRIAHNVGVSTLRAIREEARDPRGLPEGQPAGEVESVVMTRVEIHDALGRLDPLSRSIMVLREVDGLSYVEIAEILEVSLPTVKTRLYRARGTLKRATEDGER